MTLGIGHLIAFETQLRLKRNWLSDADEEQPGERKVYIARERPSRIDHRGVAHRESFSNVPAPCSHRARIDEPSLRRIVDGPLTGEIDSGILPGGIQMLGIQCSSRHLLSSVADTETHD